VLLLLLHNKVELASEREVNVTCLFSSVII